MCDVRDYLFPDTGDGATTCDESESHIQLLENLPFRDPVKLAQALVWADVGDLRSAGLCAIVFSLLYEWLPTVGVDLEADELARIIRPLNVLQMRLCPTSSELAGMADINRRMGMDFRDRGECEIGEGHSLFTERHEMVITTALKHDRKIISRDPLTVAPWPTVGEP